MRNPNTQRRAFGVLAVFVTILTVVAIWNLPKIEGSAVTTI